VPKQQVLDFLRRDIHATADHDVLVAPCEAIELMTISSDFEQVSGAVVALLVEGACRQLRGVEIAAEDRRSLEAEFAYVAWRIDLRASIGIDEARADSLGIGVRPGVTGHSHARKVQRALAAVGDVLRRRRQCRAFIRAEVIDDFDVEALRELRHQPVRQRTAARTDALQALQVDFAETFRLLEQPAQHSRGRHRIVDQAGSQLRKEYLDVERVVMMQAAADQQPRHEAGRDSRHVDEGERNQELVAGLQAAGLHYRLTDHQPLIVVARHPLGAGFGAGSPADGEDVMRRQANRLHVRA
jgi:hypothetical protein